MVNWCPATQTAISDEEVIMKPQKGFLYKSKEKISKCLDSIPKKISIFVIENSDDENFKSDIEKKYLNVRCILTGDNKGYAVANNIGLREVKTKFSLILF